MDKCRYIELFAGVGGFHIGLDRSDKDFYKCVVIHTLIMKVLWHFLIILTDQPGLSLQVRFPPPQTGSLILSRILKMGG